MRDGGAEGRPRPRTRWLWLAVAAIFVLAGATAGALPMIGAALYPDQRLRVVELSAGPVAPPGKGPEGELRPKGTEGELRAFACAYGGLPPEPTGANHCRRIMDDVARRTPLTPRQLGEARPTVDTVERALQARLTKRGGPPPAASCLPNGVCRLEVPPPSPESVRQTLAEAGIGEVIVRTARADDPAPAGSVVYAVPAGPACVVGYVATVGGQGPVAHGKLPDGTCLAG